MSGINIPASAQDAFEGNMTSNSAVQLPFAAPPFYIVNGDPKLASLKNFQFYGGWASNLENIKVAADTWENGSAEIPGLDQTELYTQQGKKINVLAGRHIIIAPIGMRMFSEMKVPNQKPKRVAPFTKGATPAMQMVALLGYRDANKNIQTWAPVMVTAKGWQVTYIQQAIDDWKKAIKPFVKELVPGAKDSILNLFWMYLGTFGQELNQKQVGENVITPMQAYIPEDLDAEKVEKLYVGESVAEFMATLSFQAQEWLKVYTDMQSAQVATGSEEAMPEDSPPPDDDSIPF